MAKLHKVLHKFIFVKSQPKYYLSKKIKYFWTKNLLFFEMFSFPATSCGTFLANRPTVGRFYLLSHLSCVMGVEGGPSLAQFLADFYKGISIDLLIYLGRWDT